MVNPLPDHGPRERRYSVRYQARLDTAMFANPRISRERLHRLRQAVLVGQLIPPESAITAIRRKAAIAWGSSSQKIYVSKGSGTRSAMRGEVSIRCGVPRRRARPGPQKRSR